MIGNQSIAILDGLGDRAYWSVMSINEALFLELWVLDANSMFKLTVDVSADTEEDLAMAKDVANVILNSCD